MNFKYKIFFKETFLHFTSNEMNLFSILLNILKLEFLPYVTLYFVSFDFSTYFFL
jgi:hypothetical protein